MLSAYVEEYEDGSIGLNYVLLDFGISVRQKPLVAHYKDVEPLLADLQRVNSAEGILTNYDWAVSTIDRLVVDIEATELLKQLERLEAKQKKLSIGEQLISFLLGKKPTDD